MDLFVMSLRRSRTAHSCGTRSEKLNAKHKSPNVEERYLFRKRSFTETENEQKWIRLLGKKNGNDF